MQKCLNIWIRLLLRATISILEAKTPHLSKVVYAPVYPQYGGHDHYQLPDMAVLTKLLFCIKKCRSNWPRGGRTRFDLCEIKYLRSLLIDFN